jgi:hypothetical protein
MRRRFLRLTSEPWLSKGTHGGVEELTELLVDEQRPGLARSAPLATGTAVGLDTARARLAGGNRQGLVRKHRALTVRRRARRE